MKLVECVPNFSEGRNKEIIKAITDAIEQVNNVKLLDVDSGEATNRTVVTFIGDPDGAAEAAFQAIKKAAELIDMSKHKGAHPRIGATDVCPFIPLQGITMEECVILSRKLGERVACELGIPVFLYENAASVPERRDLATIRAGEYEGLEKKLQDPAWKPDFGEPLFNPRSGATIIGAREFLIAYNVNLNTSDWKLANKIALIIREKGKAKRDENGKVIRDEKGNKVMVPGRLKHVKAVGWYIKEYGIAQVSINLTNYRITPPHIAYETVKEEAEKLGLVVTGSELVGLIPKEAMLMAGKYYLARQGKSVGIPEKKIIDMAVRSMKCDDLAPFNVREKIIEYRIQTPGPGLVRMDLQEFCDEVSDSSPSPGGGSVSALCGALAAALASMVGNLTHGKKNYAVVREEMETLSVQAQQLKDHLVAAVDRDTMAFNEVMQARSLPKKPKKNAEYREAAIQNALKKAARVPLEIMEHSYRAVELAAIAAQKGNKNSITDAGVASEVGYAAVYGAYLNVVVNLREITDQKFTAQLKTQADALLAKARKKSDEIRKYVIDYLENN